LRNKFKEKEKLEFGKQKNTKFIEKEEKIMIRKRRGLKRKYKSSMKIRKLGTVTLLK
jgi:hypothetical protein